MELAVVPPGEHEVLVFLLQVALLLIVARTLGLAFRRVGQPAVIGELLAGVVLGPSLFGRAFPDAFEWLFPADATQGAMLYGLAWLGLLLLLASTGIESDIDVIRKLGRPVLLVTVGSLAVPLMGGFLIGIVAPDVLIGSGTSSTTFAAFLAVALSISSLPVVAKALTELGMIRRNVGQLIVAVAVGNDIVGWILLGIVAGLATASDASPTGIATTVTLVIVFIGGALTLGQRGVDRLLRTTSGPDHGTQGLAILALVLLAGAFTQWVGVEAVLGAFVVGLVVGRSRWRDERAIHMLDTFGQSVLAPLFFATAGLRVDLGVFTDPTVALWSCIIVAVASVTKFAGAAIGARSAKLPGPEGLALGIALNARGALEIVIASIGLGIGVLTESSYGAIVIMAILTSLAAPPLLRRVLRDWPGTEEEQQRLAAEELARQRVIVSNRPPLLLSRGQPASITAAQILQLCWPPHHPATIVTTASDIDLDPVRQTLVDRPLRIVRTEGSRPERILAEAARGHAAVVVGVSDRPGEPILTPLIQALLSKATIPIVLIRRERVTGRPLPGAFARALVPITGTHTSQAALELATSMSSALGTELILTHVDHTTGLYSDDGVRRISDVVEPALRDAAARAQSGGARSITTLSRTADNAAGELNRLTLELDVDIVIAGTTTIHTGDAPKLGPVATHLLQACPMTTVIIATPPGWTGPNRT